MIRLFRYLKPYISSIIFIIIFTFLQVMTNLLLPNYTSSIINEGIIQQDIPFIWGEGLKMLAVAALSMSSTIIVSYFASKMGSGFGRDLRAAIFTKVENLALQDISDLSTASLITRTTNDVQQMQMVTNMIFRMAISAPITAIGGIILALEKQRTLSLIFTISVPVLLIVVFIIGMIAVPLFKKVQKKVDKLNLVFREKLTGTRVIRAYNKEAYETAKIETANKDLMQSSLRVNDIVSFMMPAIMVIMNMTTIAIIWYGAKFVDNGTMMPGDIIAFMQYGMQIMFAFIMLAVIFIMVPRAAASADRINEVLDKSETIQDTLTPQTLGEEISLVFDHVSFSYPEAEEPVLHDISFTVHQGETLAIIGGTGSGKSTLLNLIPRFYDTTQGKISLNGVDIKEITQETLREQIGYIPQKNTLFSGTIADNLRYGKADATVSEMEHAVKIAQASTFIAEKEDGFESYVEQEGKNFSGGQKQRLAIARAIIRKPEIYLFDDSFSALDLKTDAELRHALKAETQDAVVVIVGQRISTIKDANKIIVLDEGKVDAIGTHTELLTNSAVYREIALSQLSEEELA